MDDSVEFTEYQPGHLHLHLNINRLKSHSTDDLFFEEKSPRAKDINSCGSFDRTTRLRDLKFRYESVAASLLEKEASDVIAATNLLGLLAVRLDDLKLAIRHFEAVLEQDPDNVNAMQNLAHTCGRMNETEAAEMWNSKVQSLLGRTDQTTLEKLINERMARSLAEQAYAYAYDIGLTFYEERRQALETSITIFDRAFSIGGSSISLPERRSWYFIMATIFVRLDTLMLRSHQNERARLLGFNRAINLLKEVSKSDLLYNKALSWAYIGLFLERQSSFQTTPMAVHDCGLTGSEPMEIYSKAIQLAEKQPHILNRLAKVFLLLGKYELALGTTSMALDMCDEDAFKLSAYYCRARVNTFLYMKDLQSCKVGSSSIPDRSLLEKAMEDLEYVKGTSPSLRTYIDLGQACYYMGVDAIKESFVIEENYVNKALIYFAKALDCDMGKELPELQLLRGKCMRVKGEESNALVCFKKSIEMERSGSRNVDAFHCLMETFLAWYSHGGALKREEIITEVDHWLRIALCKYNNDIIVFELKSISHSHTHEMLELCRGSIRSGKMTLTKTFFSAFPSSIKDENTDTESAN